MTQGGCVRRREICRMPASRSPNTRQSELRATGGYWFFDWRVLVLRLAGLGPSTGGYWFGDWALSLQGWFLSGQTKSAALSLLMSYNTTCTKRTREEAAWDILLKFRRMRESSWSNFWVLCWAQHNTHYVGFLVMLASWPESAKSLGNSQIPDSRSQHNSDIISKGKPLSIRRIHVHATTFTRGNNRCLQAMVHKYLRPQQTNPKGESLVGKEVSHIPCRS